LPENKSPAFYAVKNPETAYLEPVIFHQYTFFDQGMKDQFIRKPGICHSQLQIENIDQFGWSVEMQVLNSAQQAHTGDQPDQAEIMIAVQVGNENMVDPAASDFVLIHLSLCSFSTVNKEKMIIQGNHLGGGVPVKGRNGRVVSKYGDCEHRCFLGMIRGPGPFLLILAEK
jgi:hypothetical protein